MVYVTCPNDEVAKATADKMIKNKVCSSINIFPGAKDELYWQMMKEEHSARPRMTKFINICEKVTTPFQITTSKKDKKGKKKKLEVDGNANESLVVVKTTMHHFEKVTELVDKIADRVTIFDKDAMRGLKFTPKIGVEIAGCVMETKAE